MEYVQIYDQKVTLLYMMPEESPHIRNQDWVSINGLSIGELQRQHLELPFFRKSKKLVFNDFKIKKKIKKLNSRGS